MRAEARSEFPVVRRGYDTVHVDAFVDESTAELDRLASANRDLSREIERSLAVPHPPAGMRLPILRETRMPAVWCRVGHPAQVTEQAPTLTAALHRAMVTWCGEPVQESP